MAIQVTSNSQPVKSGGAADPNGTPVKQAETKIESPYSQSKQAGGSASLGSAGGNG